MLPSRSHDGVVRGAEQRCRSRAALPQRIFSNSSAVGISAKPFTLLMVFGHVASRCEYRVAQRDQVQREEAGANDVGAQTRHRTHRGHHHFRIVPTRHPGIVGRVRRVRTAAPLPRGGNGHSGHASMSNRVSDRIAYGYRPRLGHRSRPTRVVNRGASSGKQRAALLR